MKPSVQITTGEFESILWIRVEGRGTFQTSPPIKELVDQEMAKGRSQFVIDLQQCTGMDSTFMGMMAGVGMRLRKKGTARLSIVGTDERIRESLEELGLPYLMEVEPEMAPWSDQVDQIRSDLHPLADQSREGSEEHILKCHENLCEADEANTERFKTVLEVMGSDKVSGGSDKPG